MDMQSQFVHTLEEQAGLDEATAERVAQVAMDFSKEHASEFISGHGTGSLESISPAEGAGEVGGEISGVAEMAAEDFGGTAGAAETTVESLGGTLAAAGRGIEAPSEQEATDAEEGSIESSGETATPEEPNGEKHGIFGSLFSRLIAH